MGKLIKTKEFFPFKHEVHISAAQGDHVDAARILLYYKSTLVDDVSSVRAFLLNRISSLTLLII
jgi:hypothetical protein